MNQLELNEDIFSAGDDFSKGFLVMHTGSLYHQLNRLEMSSKPILGGGLVSLCTTEVGIEGTIKAKVVFLGYCTRFGCRKLAICARTVSMQALTVILPEWNCQIYTRVSPDVNEFHFFARAIWSNIIEDVEVFKVSAEVVSEIDAVGRIAACYSPVGGVSLQWSHSGQAQSIRIPVLGVFVHWGVPLQWSSFKWGEMSIRETPWHHQSPCSTWFRLEVTVSWVTLSSLIVKCVDAILGTSSPQIINAGSRPKIILLNFTFLEDKKGKEI